MRQNAETVCLPIKTTDGVFMARYSPRGLCQLDFPAKRKNPPDSEQKISELIRVWHGVTSIALKLTLAGKVPRELPPLDLSCGTDFQRDVWRQLLRIKRGNTRTYADVSALIGKPKAMRAVGGACGANPIPVLVPCHRVVAMNGKIGGFSGGPGWKETLLAREGVFLT